jgi:beta-lactamase class A
LCSNNFYVYVEPIFDPYMTAEVHVENVLRSHLDSGRVTGVGVYAEGIRGINESLGFNSDRPFRSASTIKIAIAYELMRRVDGGDISLSDPVDLDHARLVGGSGLLRLMRPNIKPTVESMLQLMLTVSDNTASNILLDLVGKSSVNRTMLGLGLKNIRVAGKFMYTRKKRFNVATPADMAKLMAAVYLGKGISARSSRRLLRILGFQQHTGLIPSSLPSWGIRVINKPGALSDLRADVAVVWTRDWAYTIAVYVEGFKDIYAGENCVREISRTIFNRFVPHMLEK